MTMQSFKNYLRRFKWRAGAPLVWQHKPWSEEDIAAVMFLAAFVLVMLAATLLAPYA